MRTFALISTLLLILQWNSSSAQVTISDVTLPQTITVDEVKLTLNGGGLREKYWIDLYVGGLYLKNKNRDAHFILDANQPMAIRLEIVSSMISSETMEEATLEGFEKSTLGKMEAMQTRINRFVSVFRSEIKVGDIYELVYIPEKGTLIFKNGTLSDTIEGLDFKTALFGIWLGKEPAQDSLKTGLLGG